ncbi:MAG: hypothetical protein ThorAB25_23120 [Candidatus Thorarchaeota archaeon AB_25]|nr:MAG: hypothetical protein ThorAB25_23120 [Candidatus Thorarchaeota archaeon AB_25]
MLKQITSLVLLSSIIVLGVGTNAAIALDGTFSSAQIVSPFTEMQPGVYVAWEWWNETGSDYYGGVEPVYFSNVTDDYYYGEYYVEDIFENSYTITEISLSNWTSDWSFSNLLVVILLDPDASYMAWMSRQPAIEDDLWGIYWWPQEDALTGDEVFIYSSFYYSEYNSSSYYYAEYIWEDDYGVPVDPNTVIPNLKPEYEWVSWMNETYEYDYDWDYCGFGYDVNEMFRADNTEHWMNHYFSGFSTFNDTNGNGRMDIKYMEVEHDFDEDGVTDWTSYEVNETASEFVYGFHTVNAEMGAISTPHINSDKQIEWSAEIVDIQGALMKYPPYDIWFGGVGYFDDYIIEQKTIPVVVDSFELTFRFETTNDAAVVKIDQYISDFNDPVTGEVSTELEGLGLTINYWSSFTSYVIPEVPVEPTDPVTYPGEDPVPTETPPEGVAQDDDWALLQTDSLETSDVPGGSLRFSDETRTRSTVDFGGTYVWGWDGQTYDVVPAIMPYYFYAVPMLAESTTDLAYAECCWWGDTYYYSSCYAQWDGYSITHDPIFSVFPTTAPSSASAFISGLIWSSAVVGVFGVVALSVVCVRINSERK